MEQALPEKERVEGGGAESNENLQQPNSPAEKPATVWVLLQKYFIYVVWAFQYFELKEEKKQHRLDNAHHEETLQKQLIRAESDKKELRRENTLLLHRNLGVDTFRGAGHPGSSHPPADGNGTGISESPAS